LAYLLSRLQVPFLSSLPEAVPKTEYSERAQFRMVACDYLEKKYEKAMLEYEKLSKSILMGIKLPLIVRAETFLPESG